MLKKLFAAGVLTGLLFTVSAAASDDHYEVRKSGEAFKSPPQPPATPTKPDKPQPTPEKPAKNPGKK